MFGDDGFEFGELRGLGASTLVSTDSKMFADVQNRGAGDKCSPPSSLRRVQIKKGLTDNDIGISEHFCAGW